MASATTETTSYESGHSAEHNLDHQACYQAIQRRDARFDGRFYTGVLTTGIFCRPSCPARTPREANVTFFSHAAAASTAGFRPCRRCRPELAPGHPEWNRRADLVGKALSLIEQGLVDTEGVAGLANRLGVSERHLRRELKEEVGAGPTQLARSRRLWLSRLLLDQTNLAITDVAFASGFSSIRQFNDAFKEAFAATPSDLRRRPDTAASGATELTLTLNGRGRTQWADLHRFLTARAVTGLEYGEGNRFRRGVPGGWIELEGTETDSGIVLRCSLDNLDRVAQLIPLVRRVADLDTDIEPIAEHLRSDPVLAQRLQDRSLPRLPGTFDPFELAIRAVIGQQVSVAGAATLLGRLVNLATEEGDRSTPDAPDSDDGSRSEDGRAGTSGEPMIVHNGFPSAAQVAAAPLDSLGMPGKRRDTIRALAEAVAEGQIDLSPAADRDKTAADLLAVPGIGPWTAGYIAMRALDDPDGWPSGDLVLRNSLARSADDTGAAATPAQQAKDLEQRADRWRPWRAYAAMLLWKTATENTESQQTEPPTGAST